jgi:hypothetical protein
MKAGNVSDPKPNDCTLMHACIDVWYAHAGQSQVLPNLPGWTATDKDCAKRFTDTGGYGEMSVLGTSSECDPVNDANGNSYVFARNAYCGPDCAKTPDAESCKSCAVNGSGNF